MPPILAFIKPSPRSSTLSPTTVMADVLSILAFALHAAHKVYNIVEGIKGAPRDVQALRDDAFQVQEFLQTLLDSRDDESEHGLQRVGSIRSPQVNALLTKAETLTSMVDAFMKKTTTHRSGGTYTVKRFKWPLHSGEAKKLSKQFRAFYTSLTAVYTVSTSYVLRLYMSG